MNFQTMKDFRNDIVKMRYLKGLMREIMPQAIPLGIFERTVSSVTDIVNGTILIKLILDRIIMGSSMENLASFFAIILAINIFRLIVFVIYSVTIGPLDIVMDAKLREKAYKHAGELDYSCQFDQQSKNIIYWVCASIKGIVALYYSAYIKYVGVAVSFILSLILCFVYGHIGGGIIAVTICIIEFLVQKVQVRINEIRFSEAQQRNVFARKKIYFKNDIFLNKENNQSIRVNNIFSFFENKYLELSKEDINTVVEHEKRILKKDIIKEIPRKVVMYFFIMAYLFFLLFVKKDITEGTFFALLAAFTKIRDICPVSIFPEFQNLGQYVDMIKYFFEDLKTEQGGSLHVDPNDFVIEFKNVYYTYPGCNEPVLKNLNFKLSNGDMTVLLGENGAGKSTILLLLYRLVEPQEGEITLNGICISEYDLLEYRSLFGTMFQDDNVFPLTLGDNVALELDHASHEQEILMALKKAGFNNKVIRKENAIKTSVTKRFDSDGFVPSGGEARKIVFARNMYSDAPIKFFDEYDSNIDPISEVRLNNAMEEVKGTKLIITHRLPIAKRATSILVLKNGSVVELGNHEELIRKKGMYYDLLGMERNIYAG